MPKNNVTAPAKVLSNVALDLIAARFRALSEPTRLRLLNLLMQGDQTVGQLVEGSGSGQANVSKHLAVLREAGMVAMRKDGLTTICAISDPMVRELCEMMCSRLKDEMEAKAAELGMGGEGTNSRGRLGREDLGAGFFRQAEEGLGDEEEQHSDEEGAPNVAGKRGVGGLAGLVEQGVAGAVESLVEQLAGEDFRGIFAGWAVDSDEAFAKAEDAGLVGGVGGIWGAVVVEAGAGFTGAEAGRVAADGGEVGGVEAAGTGGDDALDGGQEDVSVGEVGPGVVG